MGHLFCVNILPFKTLIFSYFIILNITFKLEFLVPVIRIPFQDCLGITIVEKWRTLKGLMFKTKQDTRMGQGNTNYIIVCLVNNLVVHFLQTKIVLLC